MSDHELRDHLNALVIDEPPLNVAIDPVVARGQRLRARRRIAYASAGLVAAAVVAAAIAVPLALTDDEPESALAIAPISVPPVAAAGPEDDLTPLQRRILRAITEASPAGYTFEASADRWDGPNLEGEADDDATDSEAPGRLMLGVSPTNGSQQLRPCQDPEYRQGGSCTERELDNGSVLSMRGLVNFDGIRNINVALTNRDGSGLDIEAGNFELTWPLPERIGPDEDKADLIQISRERPPYTVDQLAEVVLAVARVIDR